MTKKLRIAVDIDNVIRAFSKYAIQKWNEQFPEKAVLDLSMWSSHNWCYTLFSGKTHSEKREKCFSWWVENGVYKDAPSLVGAREAILALAREGHKIIIASHQTHNTHEATGLETTKWLYDNDIYWDELYYTDNKSNIRSDLLIDDNPNIIDNFLKKGVSDPKYAIMFEYPWNLAYQFNLPKEKMVFVASPASDGNAESEYWLMAQRIIDNIHRRTFHVYQ